MSDNPKNKGKADFQALLYYRFRIANPRPYKVADIAEHMGISADTLNAYISSELPFPINRLPDLLIATGDAEYLSYLCEECGYFPSKKISTAEAGMFSPHDYNAAAGCVKTVGEGEFGVRNDAVMPPTFDQNSHLNAFKRANAAGLMQTTRCKKGYWLSVCTQGMDQESGRNSIVTFVVSNHGGVNEPREK